jgi:RHS repeat-associated protein
VFDPEGRMSAYGTSQTDGYTGDGLRGWKQNSGGKTYFLYDGEQAVCELSSSGAVTATDTFGADGLISRHTSSGSVFYEFDLSGNVAERRTSSDTLASSDLTDGFGSRQTTDTTHDPFGFGGQWGGYTDTETGLTLLTHRFYDPATGRFLTRDLIGYAGGIDLYAYTQNDPVNKDDPEGEQAVESPPAAPNPVAPNPTPIPGKPIIPGGLPPWVAPVAGWGLGLYLLLCAKKAGADDVPCKLIKTFKRNGKWICIYECELPDGTSIIKWYNDGPVGATPGSYWGPNCRQKMTYNPDTGGMGW